MKFNKKYCLLFLMTVLVLLLGAGMVSASEAGSDVQVVKDNQGLSTPDNYDVDNVVQSDRVLTKSEANVEKTSTKDDTNNNESSIDTFVDTDNTNEDLQTIASGSGHSAKVSVNEISGRTLNIAGLENSDLLQETIDVNKISINSYDSLASSEDMTPILTGETTDSSTDLVDTNTKSDKKSQETDKTIAKVQSNRSTKTADDSSFELPYEFTTEDGLKLVIGENAIVSEDTYQAIGVWSDWYGAYYETPENPFLMNDTTWTYCLDGDEADPSGNGGYPPYYRRITLTGNEQLINRYTQTDILPYLRTFVYYYWNATDIFSTQSTGKVTFNRVIYTFTEGNYTDRHSEHYNNWRIGNEGKLVWDYVNEVMDIVDSGNGINNTGVFNGSDFLTYQFYLYVVDRDLTGHYSQPLLGFNILTKIDVTKEWDDGNNFANKRPDNITINLYGNDVYIQNVTLNKFNNWNHTFTELPVYYAYNLSSPLTSNDYSYDTLYEDCYDITLRKDMSEYTGSRISYIIIDMYADGEYIGYTRLYNSSNFQYTLKYMTKYREDGETPIQYTFEDRNSRYEPYPLIETKSDDYQVKHFNYTITNESFKTEEAYIEIFKNGEFEDLGFISDENGWSLLLLNLPIDASADDYSLVYRYNQPRINVVNYTVGEVIVSDEYTSTITETRELTNPLMPTEDEVESCPIPGYPYIDEDINDILTTVTITNTQLIEINVTKVWNDSDNQDGIRPNNITVALYKGDELYDNVTLSDENDWKHTFSNLIMYENGDLINYRVEEVKKNGDNFIRYVPEGYTLEINEVSDYNFTFTNTHIPEKTSIVVNKVWDDANDTDGLRPEVINLRFLVNGVYNETIALEEANNWTKLYYDLPKYSEGSLVNYTFEEINVPEGYTVSYSSMARDPTEIETVIHCENVGQSSDGDTYRIYVTNLTNDLIIGGEIDIFNESGSRIDFAGLYQGEYYFTWSYDYEFKIRIIYSANRNYLESEAWFDKHNTIPSDDDENEVMYRPDITFNVLNTHVPNSVNITVTKFWNDTDNEDGIRPVNITVYLLANKQPYAEITLDESNNWIATFTNLPEYIDGEKINYTIVEDIPEGYDVTYGDIVEESEDKKETIVAFELIDLNEDEDNKLYGTFNVLVRDAEDEYVTEGNIIILDKNGEQVYSGQILDGITVVDLPVELSDNEVPPGLPETVFNYTIVFEENENYLGSNGTFTLMDILIYPTTEYYSPPWLFDDGSWYYCKDPERRGTPMDYLMPYVPIHTDIKIYNKVTGEDVTEYILTFLYNHAQDTENFTEKGETGLANQMQKVIEIIAGHYGHGDFRHLDHSDRYNDFTKSGHKLSYFIDETVRLVESGNGISIHGIKNITSGGVWKYDFYEYKTYYEMLSPSGAQWQHLIKLNYTFVPNVIKYTTNLTNNHTVKTQVNVTKVWDDDAHTSLRPNYVPVQLYINDTGNLVEIGEPVMLSEENNWTYLFEDLDKYDNGVEIVYVVDEVPTPKGYNKTIVNQTIGELVIEHVWDETVTAADVPESITVLVYADGEQISSVTLNSENNWKEELDNLSKFNSENKTIEYRIVYTLGEETINKTVVLNINNYTFTINNKYYFTSLNVTKVWDDTDNQDGKRTDSITVELFADNEKTGKFAVLDESNNWNYNYTYLPVYDEEGNIIEYSVDEVSVPEGYTKTVTNISTFFNITNTHKPEKVTVNVTKIWNDNDNQDGIRPDNITVALFKGDELYETVILSEDNDWKHTFKDLPKYENGELIDYVVDEGVYEFILRGRDPNFRSEAPIGYTFEISEESENNFTITNTHIPEKTNISIIKSWTDDNDKVGLRPDYIIVQLYANGVEKGSPVVLEPDEDGVWRYDFIDLDLYYNHGTLISYTVEEVVSDDYIETHNFTVNITISSLGMDVPEEIEPESDVIYLLADGEKVDSVEIDNIYDKWAHTFTDLPVYDESGKLINYTFAYEYEGKYYDLEPYYHYNMTCNYSVSMNNRITGIRTVSVSKVWDDADNQDGKRPDEVTVELVVDGVPSGQTLTLTGPEFEEEFENLPMYHLNGTLIVYNVTEVGSDVPEGYTLSNVVFCEGRFRLINTHVPENISVNVTKVWDDVDDNDRVRPANVTVILLQNGEKYRAVVLNATGDWKYTFNDLPKYYDEGKEYVYNVTEVAVSGYTMSVSNNSAYNFTITNIHELELTELNVTKVWNDSDNQDGLRVPEIHVVLMDDVEEIQDAVLNAGNDWKHTFTELVKYHDGKLIEYTLVEDNVDGYDTEIVFSNGVFTVTNTHVPEVVNVTVNKVWNDSDNQDGIRPEEVTLKLKADGREYTVKLVKSTGGKWNYTFTDLPKYSNGQEIVYTIEEVNIAEGYTVSYSDDTLSIINTHVPEVTEVNVSKVWDDAEDNDGKRPGSVTVDLLADGVKINETTLSSSNDWKATFNNLPVNKDGKAIVYTINESSVPAGYTVKVVFCEGVFKVVNSYIPENTSISVSKVWEDNNDQDAIRPDAVFVSVLANGEEYKLVKLTGENGWTVTVGGLPKYSNGKEIVYTVEEAGVPDGYTAVVDGLTITNTHVPEVISVNVSKVWKDNNNNDGVRPESVTVNLLADGVKYASATLNEGNNWKFSFDNLPLNKEGRKVIYTVTEDSVEGYITSLVNCNGTFKFINSHDDSKVNITINKVWEDANNQDAIRPENVTVEILANGERYDVVVINSTGDWKITVSDLPEFVDGQKVVYTVREIRVETGYTSSVDGFTITNTHEPFTKEINVTKIWNDNNSSLRPESVTVHLMDGDNVVATVSLSAGNDWKATFTDLPVNRDGKAIVYTVKEVEVPDYTTEIKDCCGNFKIVNTPIVVPINITVNKVWNDNNNNDGIRPGSVTIRLLADNEEVRVVTLTGDDWTYTFTDLPEYKDGKKVTYTVEEVEVPAGYTAVADGLTITNTHVDITKNITVSKFWDDDNNNDGKRPGSVTIRLLADGNEVATATLSDDNDWKHIFEDLPVNKDGKVIVYNVTEDPVDPYVVSITNVDDEFIVTNSYNITKINLTVNKVWVDDDNNDGLRPDNITVILYANGEELVAAVVGEDNDWTYTFSDLQKYNNGYLIEYTIDELPVDEYVAVVDGLTITNTHDIITKDIPVSKVWVDNNNNDGTRPDSVTINLYAFGRKVSSISITEADGWEGVFKDLPVYIKGNEIVYTIVEESVPDYWVTYNGSMIINTHDLVNTSVTVTKVWNDSNNNDGVRPDSVSVNLYADGVKVSSIVLSSNNSWTHTFDKLPKYNDGQIINYTVDEEVVGAYSVSITEDSNYFIIVNNYETELINLTINKIWDDKDNYYGKRPVNVTVKVFADGEEIDSVVLSEENNWTCELNNLPKYDNGKLINYSVDEVNITYYHYSIEAKDNYTFTVTNTLNKVRVFKWAWKLIGWNESYYERVEVDDNVPVVKRSSKIYAKGKGIGKYQPRYRAPYRNKNHISKGKHYINRLMFREHYRLFIYLYNQYLYGNMTYSEFVALLQLNGIQIDESNAWDSNGTLIFDYDDLEDVPDSIGLHDNGGHVKDSSDRVEKYKPISNSGVIDSGEVEAEVVDVEE